mgnify:FL=1
MHTLSDRDGAAQLAGKLVEEIARPIRLGNRQFTLGASVGIAIYPDDGTDGPTILRRADHAMYQVKRGGKNGYAFAGPENAAV